jgi:hypothetical protein
MTGRGLRHGVRARVMLALLVLMPACGSSAGGGTGGASGGPPGGAGGPGGRGGGAGGGAGGATGGAGPGTGGSAGSGLCPGDYSSQSFGTIGDHAFALDPEGSASSGSPMREGTWSTLRAASTDQVLLAWGQGVTGGGTPPDVGGVIVVPGASPSSAMVYCASDAEPVAGDAATSPLAVVSHLSFLGNCPGTPVSGSIRVCTAKGPAVDGGAQCYGFGASGTVEGMDIGLGSQGGSVDRPTQGSDALFDFIASGNNQGGIVVSSAADGSATGWLRLPNGTGSTAGTIYCLANGQVASLGAGAYAVTFQTIGRLGQCPGATPIAGQIDLCN